MKAMNMREVTAAAISFLAICSLVVFDRPAFAEEVAGEPAAPAAKTDKSGTNPLNFQKEFKISNEYADLDGSRYSNTTNISYSHPFASNFAVKATLPLKASDVPTNALTRVPDDEFGLGDVKLKASYVPYIDKKLGVIVGSEFFFDTASESNLGRGRYSMAPLGGVALFIPGQWIFAPVYQHNFDLGGDDTRREIHEGYIDLYVVKVLPKQKMWAILDPTITVDYENDNKVNCTFDLEIGKMVAKVWGGVASVYVRPSLGTGKSRPYEWSVETGVKVVGF